MELSGFHFEAAGCDFANVLPITTNLFDCIVAFKANTTNVPAFSCMVGEEDDTFNEDQLYFAKHTCDRRVWDDQLPRKIGLYHAFARPHTKDSLEHKLFIVCSGSLPFLKEEFHRL
jgi:hypothetical protein